MKLHAEQLTLQHGAALAARYHALSADHLEYLCEEDVAAMARHGTVAVLLPGAYYFLREKQLPPLDLLRQYRVPIALASDLNPGTSPVLSLRLMMNMACTLFRMTPEEALAGVTLNGAEGAGAGYSLRFSGSRKRGQLRGVGYRSSGGAKLLAGRLPFETGDLSR
ncbi:imidazolonepropionase [Klebsiella aerogenes]|nr:imidazolonepropionase [Klebsiella aerogenes]